MCQPRRIEFRSPRRLLWGTPHDSYEPVCACGPLPQHWAETPIHNRRPRRCGSDPEPVSFHHASPCESRGGKAGVSLTVSAPGDLLASRQRLGMLRTTSAAVLWRGAEAAGVAYAMVEATYRYDYGGDSPDLLTLRTSTPTWELRGETVRGRCHVCVRSAGAPRAAPNEPAFHRASTSGRRNHDDKGTSAGQSRRQSEGHGLRRRALSVNVHRDVPIVRQSAPADP